MTLQCRGTPRAPISQAIGHAKAILLPHSNAPSVSNLRAGYRRSTARNASHYYGGEPPEPRFIRQGYVLLKPPWIYDIGNGLVYDDLTPCSQRAATPTAYRSRSCKMKRFVCNAAAFTLAQWDAHRDHFFPLLLYIHYILLDQVRSLALAWVCGFVHKDTKTPFCPMCETSICVVILK